MTPSIVRATSRRRFLQFLAGSPLVASGAISAYAAETPSKLPDPMIWAPATDELIKSPKDAMNVCDFEPVNRACACGRTLRRNADSDLQRSFLS